MPPRPEGTFTVPGSAAALATDAPATRDLPTLADHLALDDADRGASPGVRLAPDDDIGSLLASLDALAVVAVDFPTFTDGRGFSHARRLRAVHGWRGELRAIGDVRPDQARQMLRCGFDALEFAAAPDPAALRRSLTRFPAPPYQPSYPVPALDRTTGASGA